MITPPRVCENALFFGAWPSPPGWFPDQMISAHQQISEAVFVSVDGDRQISTKRNLGLAVKREIFVTVVGNCRSCDR